MSKVKSKASCSSEMLPVSLTAGSSLGHLFGVRTEAILVQPRSPPLLSVNLTTEVATTSQALQDIVAQTSQYNHMQNVWFKPKFKTNESDIASVLVWSPLTLGCHGVVSGFPQQSPAWFMCRFCISESTYSLKLFLTPKSVSSGDLVICRCELSKGTLSCLMCAFLAEMGGGDPLVSWLSSHAVNKCHFCCLFSAGLLTFLCEWTNNIY